MNSASAHTLKLAGPPGNIRRRSRLCCREGEKQQLILHRWVVQSRERALIFSIELVQASDRRSFAGSFSRIGVQREAIDSQHLVESFENAGCNAGASWRSLRARLRAAAQPCRRRRAPRPDAGPASHVGNALALSIM
jgi:hypothetical protein